MALLGNSGQNKARKLLFKKKFIVHSEHCFLHQNYYEYVDY